MEKHLPVLEKEIIEALEPKAGMIILDGTVGYGGHATALYKTESSLTYIGLDRDLTAITATKDRLRAYDNVHIVHESYRDADTVLEGLGIPLVDGILLDLGASSPQFDEPERGFSFMKDGPLDMRFDIDRQEKTAADILNTYPVQELISIFREYGEERYAKTIATAIVDRRKETPFVQTQDLSSLLEGMTPKHKQGRIHPATRVFQALRIEVNQELKQLKEALPKLVNLLKPGGTIAIISFHSLEDRIVKQFFREAQKDCVCPKEFPVCRCKKEQTLKIITKKPIQAAKTEIQSNPRSRSAKMRIAQRV